MGTVLGQIIMSSNEPSILFYEKEAIEQFEFFFLIIIITYTLKMCIVCQVTSIILEQFRKFKLREKSLDEDPKLKEKRSYKNLCRRWICIPCELWGKKNDGGKGAGKKKGK